MRTVRMSAVGTAVLVLSGVLGTVGVAGQDGFSGSPNAVTPEVRQVIDDYVATWNDHDPEAFQAMITDDYEFGFFGDLPMPTSRVASDLAGSGAIDWHVEMIGDPIMLGDGPWIVGTTVVITGQDPHFDPPHGLDVVSVLLVEEDEGTLRVAGHWCGGPGSLD